LRKQGAFPATVGNRDNLVIGQWAHRSERTAAPIAHTEHTDNNPFARYDLVTPTQRRSRNNLRSGRSTQSHSEEMPPGMSITVYGLANVITSHRYSFAL